MRSVKKSKYLKFEELTAHNRKLLFIIWKRYCRIMVDLIKIGAVGKDTIEGDTHGKL